MGNKNFRHTIKDNTIESIEAKFSHLPNDIKLYSIHRLLYPSPLKFSTIASLFNTLKQRFSEDAKNHCSIEERNKNLRTLAIKTLGKDNRYVFQHEIDDFIKSKLTLLDQEDELHGYTKRNDTIQTLSEYFYITSPGVEMKMDVSQDTIDFLARTFSEFTIHLSVEMLHQDKHYLNYFDVNLDKTRVTYDITYRKGHVSFLKQCELLTLAAKSDKDWEVVSTHPTLTSLFNEAQTRNVDKFFLGPPGCPYEYPGTGDTPYPFVGIRKKGDAPYLKLDLAKERKKTLHPRRWVEPDKCTRSSLLLEPTDEIDDYFTIPDEI